MIMEAVDAFDQAFGLENIDVIFIENVGNLVCPVDFDLGENRPSHHDSLVARGRRQAKSKYRASSSTGAQLLNKVDGNGPGFRFLRHG